MRCTTVNMHELFFELIRVAIGTQDTLSHLPSEREWGKLYRLSEMQSLVGICFYGLRRLGGDADGGFTKIGMGKEQYFNWMGMAWQIQERNDLVNHQCVELQKRLMIDGMESTILKGQGVAQLYCKPLRGLRQSGDIDIYVDCGMKKAVDYVQRIAPTNEVNHKHVQMHVFKGTEVEMHYIAAELHCPWQNNKLQKFFALHNNKEKVMLEGVGEINVPEPSFNLTHLLTHTYRHLFGDGIGLRQVMDLYFALCHFQDYSDDGLEEIQKVVRKAGMERFASAMMWVQNRVFGLDLEFMPWEPNQRDGVFLLNEIMMAGNFGKYDKRINRERETRGKRFLRVTKQNMRLFRFSPWEVICTPLWRIWHFVWMRSQGYTQG